MTVTTTGVQQGRASFNVTLNQINESRGYQPIVFSVTQPITKRISVPLVDPLANSR